MADIDPVATIKKIQDSLTSAQSLFDNLDGQSTPSSLRQADALCDAAVSVAGSCADALGGGSGDGNALASAVDATVDAIITAGASTDGWPDDGVQAMSLVSQAENDCDDLLDALGLDDPDDATDVAEDAPAAPAAPAKPAPGMPPAAGKASVKKSRLAAPPPAAPDAAAPGSGSGDGGSGDGGDAVSQISTVQDSLSKAQDLFDKLDGASNVPASVRQVDALCDAAVSVAGQCATALGGSSSGDDGDTLAAAVDSVIDSIITEAGSDQSGWPTEATQALDLVKQADTDIDALLKTLGVDDPDEAVQNGEETPAPPAAKPPASSEKPPPQKAAASDNGARFAAPPAEDAPEDTDNQRFDIPIMVLEGVDTGDGRRINPDALTWRDLPLPLMAITKTTFGHEDAELVGSIDTIERVDASGMNNPKTGQPYGEGVQALKASGKFTNLENAQMVAGLIEGDFLRGVSVDIGDVVSELEFKDPEGEDGDIDEEDILDILFMDFGDVTEVLLEGRVMGATVCPFPAFEGAYIEIADDVLTDPAAIEPAPSLAASARPQRRIAVRIMDERGARSCAPCKGGKSMVASAGPLYPSADWFKDPQFQAITPMTITDDGRIFGHLAVWGECHVGMQSECFTPPHSGTDYGVFMTGELKTLEGDFVPVGQITMNTGHAGMELGVGAAMAHYDDTGTAVADVSMGEDMFGIWFSGAMRPDVSELHVRRLRASGLSGDWRRIKGNLELVGALAVNVQGYPIPRSRVASGATTALVAAGGRDVIAKSIRRSSARDIAQFKELQEASTWVKILVEERVAQLRDRVYRPKVEELRRRVHKAPSSA